MRRDRDVKLIGAIRYQSSLISRYTSFPVLVLFSNEQILQIVQQTTNFSYLNCIDHFALHAFFQIRMNLLYPLIF